MNYHGIIFQSFVSIALQIYFSPLHSYSLNVFILILSSDQTLGRAAKDPGFYSQLFRGIFLLQGIVQRYLWSRCYNLMSFRFKMSFVSCFCSLLSSAEALVFLSTGSSSLYRRLTLSIGLYVPWKSGRVNNR